MKLVPFRLCQSGVYNSIKLRVISKIYIPEKAIVLADSQP